MDDVTEKNALLENCLDNAPDTLRGLLKNQMSMDFDCKQCGFCDSDSQCIMQYKPVCHQPTGTTFSNDCVATEAGYATDLIDGPC